MLKELIALLLSKLAVSNRALPLIHLASKYEFEADKPTHIKFAVVDLGDAKPSGIEALKKVCLRGELIDRTTELKLIDIKTTTFEGLVEYSCKADLLRVLKNNNFYNVVLTPYLEIGIINGKKVLVDVRVPENIKPKTKKEGR